MRRIHQSDYWQRSPILSESAGKLFRKVRSITAASTISTNENFTLTFEAIDYQIRNFFNFREYRFAFTEMLQEPDRFIRSVSCRFEFHIIDPTDGTVAHECQYSKRLFGSSD